MRKARWPKRLVRIFWVMAPALMVLGVALPGLNQGDLRVDSHVYTAVTLRMLESGDFIAPMLGNTPYHNKPPLTFWMQAPALKLANPELFPPPLWATRVHVIACVMLLASLSFLVFKELVNRRVAITGAMVLALTHEVFRYMHTVSLDLVILMLMMAAAWPVVRAAGVQRGQPGCRWIAMLAGVPIGLALLVKPVLALLFFPIVIAWVLAIGRRRMLPPLLIGMGVALLVAAPWHIAMHQRYPETFLSRMYVHQSLDRATGEMGRHAPWWVPTGTLVRTYVPWIGVLAVGGVLALRRRTWMTGQRAADLLAIITVLTWMTVLSVFSDKQPRYQVPVYPWLALLVGGALSHLFGRSGHRRLGERSRWNRVMRGSVYVAPVSILLVCAVLGAWMPVQVHRGPPKWRAALLEYLDAYQRDVVGDAGAPIGTESWPTLWHAPKALRGVAHLYIERGVYPSVAHSEETPWGGWPEAGDLMLFSDLTETDERHRPRPGDELLTTIGSFSIVRLGSDWTGEYVFGPPAAK